MNKQGWIAAIMALVLGVVIGYFLIPDGKTGKGDGGDKGRGLEGDRGAPSTLPQVAARPDGSWPMVNCSGGPRAIEMLDHIYYKASHDSMTGQLDPEMGKALLQALYRCAEGHAGTDAGHCTSVQQALGAAHGGNWDMSRGKLEHEDE